MCMALVNTNGGSCNTYCDNQGSRCVKAQDNTNGCIDRDEVDAPPALIWDGKSLLMGLIFIKITIVNIFTELFQGQVGSPRISFKIRQEHQD